MRKFPYKLTAAFCIAVMILARIPVQRTYALGVEFNDTFTETGTVDVALASHTPDTGTSWTQIINNDGASALEVGWVSDVMQVDTCASNEGAGYTADASYTSTDYFVETTMKGSVSNPTYYWIGLRVQDASNGYWLRFNRELVSPSHQMYKVVSGTWSTIGSAYTTAIAVNSVVKFEVVGSTLKAYDDGVEIISTTDTDISATGEAGAGMGDLTNNGTDDCGAGQQLDDFKVTTTEAAAPPATAAQPPLPDMGDGWWF